MRALRAALLLRADNPVFPVVETALALSEPRIDVIAVHGRHSPARGELGVGTFAQLVRSHPESGDRRGVRSDIRPGRPLSHARQAIAPAALRCPATPSRRAAEPQNRSLGRPDRRGLGRFGRCAGCARVSVQLVLPVPGSRRHRPLLVRRPADRGGTPALLYGRPLAGGGRG